MAFNKYSLCDLGLTESELLAIKTTALANLATGKTTVSITAPGLASNFEVFANPAELLAAAVLALKVLDPDTYGQPPVNRVVGYTI